MKYHIPVICLIFFGAGFWANYYYNIKVTQGVYEYSVARDSAYQVRLLTVTLSRLRQNKIENAIETLEHSLAINEILLNSCQSSSCRAIAGRELEEAKGLISNYRNNHSSTEQP